MHDERLTYLVLDGENVDATLGGSVLNRRPAPEERPRWERVLAHAREVWHQPVRALFFLNASSGQLPMSFVQALVALGYRPVPLSGPAGVKVVDIGIQRTLEAITERDADVILASHDGDFLPQMRTLIDGRRRVALLGFPEFINAGYQDVAGLLTFDLEHDTKAFTKPLPRLRIIELDAFDPNEFL